MSILCSNSGINSHLLFEDVAFEAPLSGLPEERVGMGGGFAT